ncbi:hypothetical protein PMIN06_008838 [Paraphaeosphaeria minitans]
MRALQCPIHGNKAAVGGLEQHRKSEVPTVSGGALWPDHAIKLFYLFSGVYTEGSPNASNHLWFFNTIYNTWNKTVPDDGQQEILWPAYGVLTVMDECLAYLYGGYLAESAKMERQSTNPE